MLATLSRQRTMPVTCSTSWLRIVSGSVSGCGGDIGVKRHRRRLDDDIAQRIAHRFGGGLHQRAVERRRDRQRHRALGAHVLGHLDRAVDRALVAGDHDLRRVIVVGDGADLALRGRVGDLLRQREVGAEQRRHRALRRPAPPAASPARAASAASRSSRGRTIRPRTAPNIRRGCGRRRSSRHFGHAAIASASANTAIECAMIAGCAFSVSLSSSSGPSRISRNRFWPSASSTSSKTSRAARLASASAAPMPTAWLPCPGKMNARIDAPAMNRGGD